MRPVLVEEPPPGSLFSIYGFNLANLTAQPTSTTYPLTLGGAIVTVNGESAPLSYVSPGQINAEMPLDIKPGVATVVVTVATQPTPGGFVDDAKQLGGRHGARHGGSGRSDLRLEANRAVAQNLPLRIRSNTPRRPRRLHGQRGTSSCISLVVDPFKVQACWLPGHAAPSMR